VTGQTFQTVATFDGRRHVLLGVGARKYFGFKVYAMGLYVEEDPSRRAFPRLAASAGGSDHDSLARGELANEFVILGDFSKAAVLHFVRDVSGKDSQKNYREALGDSASARAPVELKRDAEAFLALFDDVKSGDVVTIRTTADGQIFVDVAGKTRPGPKNLRLSHDIWDIWLGPRPISSDLKKGLVDRIDTLGR
jgi:hypothetical protein